MIDSRAEMGAAWLARWRVPLGWIFGLAALYLARPRPEWLLAGLGVGALGEALRLWASGHLVKNQRLTTGGPYAWTRNPLYLGSLLVGLGFCLAAGRATLFVVFVAFFATVYVPVMKREAKSLEEAYVGEYFEYASRVPLFFPRPPRGGVASSTFSWARVRANREHLTMMGLVLVTALLWAKWKLTG